MNLINQDMIEAGDLLYATGEIDTTNLGYFHTSNIAIIPGNNVYKFMINNTGILDYICFYDQIGNYIEGGLSSYYHDSTTNYISLIPSNVRFIKLSFHCADGVNPVSSHTKADIIALKPTFTFANEQNSQVLKANIEVNNITANGQLYCQNFVETFSIAQVGKNENIFSNQLYEF